MTNHAPHSEMISDPAEDPSHGQPAASIPLSDLWIHDDMDRDNATAASNASRKELKAAHTQAVDDLIGWRRRALTAEARLNPNPLEHPSQPVSNRMIAAAMLNRSHVEGESDEDARSEVENMLRAALLVADTGPIAQSQAEQSAEPTTEINVVYSYCAKMANGTYSQWQDRTPEHAARLLSEDYASSFKVRKLYATPERALAPADLAKLTRYGMHMTSEGNFFGVNTTGSFVELVEVQAWLSSRSEEASRRKLTVWYGAMPESNGKTNYTAILMRRGGSALDDVAGSFTISRSEYPDRVRYDADCVRYLIGELNQQPDILDYDGSLHSGYVDPVTNKESATQREHALDGERLDFMADREAWIAYSRDHESCRLFHHDDEHDGMPIMGWVPDAWGKTPREAIDKAMAFCAAQLADVGIGKRQA